MAADDTPRPPWRFSIRNRQRRRDHAAEKKIKGGKPHIAVDIEGHLLTSKTA
ncbi:MAG: hypothetical protein ABI076_04990 [Acidobacteriaceae bacterium]